jgi:hypothetical protein
LFLILWVGLTHFSQINFDGSATNRQKQVRFTFDVSKCDRIFDELLKNGHIKCSHAIPSLEVLKQCAYCKWHNSFSHATNDCNVFRRKVQSAVNEGRLAMHEMQVDKALSPVHPIDLDNAKVLFRPEQAEGAKGKNVIISEPRTKNVNDKILTREVTLEKTPDGKESLKITVKASRPGGAREFLAKHASACCLGTTGQTGQA